MDGAAPRSVPKRWRRWLLRIGAVLVLGVVFLIILDGFMRSRTPPPPPLPNPNGYDDLVRAGSLMTRLDDYGQASIEKIRQFSKQNAEAFKIARIGLGRECRIPIPTASAEVSVDKIVGLRRLADGIEVEGMLAEKEGRASDALHGYMDHFHLGFQVVQGGCFIDLLVGAAMQAIAIKHLNPMAKQLGAAESRELITGLEKWSFNEKLMGEVQVAERDFEVRDYNFFQRVGGRIVSLFHTPFWVPDVNARVLFTRTNTVLLLTQIALHAYQLEHGAIPQSLSELVPGYLKELPLDPHSGKPLIYRTTSERTKLYSVGPDGKDDQGLGDDVAAEPTG